MSKNILHITESKLQGLISESIKRSLPDVLYENVEYSENEKENKQIIVNKVTHEQTIESYKTALNESAQEISEEDVRQSLSRYLQKNLSNKIEIYSYPFERQIKVIEAFIRPELLYYNFIKGNRILFDEWFTEYHRCESANLIKVKNEKGYNLIGKEFTLLLSNFYKGIEEVNTDGIFEIYSNDKEVVNFVDAEGNVLSDVPLIPHGWGFLDNYQEYIYIQRIDDGLYNVLGFKEKKIIFDEWFDSVVYDEDWDNLIYIQSAKTKRWNMSTYDGDIYFDKWFDLLNIFTDNCAIVEINKKYNIIKIEDNTLVFDKWLDSCCYYDDINIFLCEYDGNFIKIDKDGNKLTDWIPKDEFASQLQNLPKWYESLNTKWPSYEHN